MHQTIPAQSTEQLLLGTRLEQLDLTTFPLISDYGVIGNCHTAALVSSKGSIDWLCLPRFDSPSLFARILDLDRGGYWEIRPTTAFTSTHRYLEDSNILETTFTCADGKVSLIDFMDTTCGSKQRQAAPGRLIRIVQGMEGAVELVSCCVPCPDYGREPPQYTAAGTSVSFGQFKLSGSTAWQIDSGALTCRFKVAAGDRTSFTLEAIADTDLFHPILSPLMR